MPTPLMPKQVEKLTREREQRVRAEFRHLTGGEVWLAFRDLKHVGLQRFALAFGDRLPGRLLEYFVGPRPMLTLVGSPARGRRVSHTALHDLKPV